MDKLPPKDDWAYWYKKSEDFIENLSKDKMTNIMLLASEFRNQFQLGSQSVPNYR
jgi:hypothetical protein